MLDTGTHDAEALEQAALKALHLSATVRTRVDAGLTWVEDDEVRLSIASALPPSAIVVNRGWVRGDRSSLLRACRIYREAGVSRFFLHAESEPNAADLAACGLREARAWQKFSRDADGAPDDTPPHVDIRQVAPGEAADFARIACAAFDLGQIAERWIAGAAGHDGWHFFLSEIDGQPAGTGALFIRDGLAWTDFGATDPEFRQRGAQSAILRHRVRFAEQAGCHTVITGTGVAVPGDPQHSYANILRAGFTETAQRKNYAPA